MTKAIAINLAFLEFPAGRKLDCLVTQEVLGLIPVWGDWWPSACCDGQWNCSLEKAESFAFEYPGGVPMPDGKEYCSKNLMSWSPSTQIQDAWEVLEKLYEETKHAKAKRLFKWERFEDGSACAKPGEPWGVQFGESCQFAFGATAPLAICRAAILHARKLDWPLSPQVRQRRGLE